MSPQPTSSIAAVPAPPKRQGRKSKTLPDADVKALFELIKDGSWASDGTIMEAPEGQMAKTREGMAKHVALWKSELARIIPEVTEEKQITSRVYEADGKVVFALALKSKQDELAVANGSAS